MNLVKFAPSPKRAVRTLNILACLLLISCAGPEPGRFSRLEGTGVYPAKSNDYNVQVFQGEPPSRPFTEIARLDVHLENAFFAHPSLKDALPELERQARLSGADAIIKILERKSVLNETGVLHVTATAIKYKDAP
jgi:hypothetical protein